LVGAVQAGVAPEVVIPHVVFAVNVVTGFTQVVAKPLCGVKVNVVPEASVD
jgi:hypothetical protein